MTYGGRRFANQLQVVQPPREVPQHRNLERRPTHPTHVVVRPMCVDFSSSIRIPKPSSSLYAQVETQLSIEDECLRSLYEMHNRIVKRGGVGCPSPEEEAVLESFMLNSREISSGGSSTGDDLVFNLEM